MTDDTLESLRAERDQLQTELVRERARSVFLDALTTAGVQGASASDAAALLLGSVSEFDGKLAKYRGLTATPQKIVREFLKDRPHFVGQPLPRREEPTAEPRTRTPLNEMTASELLEGAGAPPSPDRGTPPNPPGKPLHDLHPDALFEGAGPTPGGSHGR
ncbi:MAG: hypothetical protein AAGF12_36920 [Myxococcota bacterium]